MTKQITNLHFSPTGNAKKIGAALAQAAAAVLQLPVTAYDITLPQNRIALPVFTSEDLLIITMPVYAGRLPNKIAPDLIRLLKGDHTKAIAAVTYGNRHYDDALSEMKFILENAGFELVGAMAVPSEHAFSKSIATGRPDETDLAAIADYMSALAEKLKTELDLSPVNVPGNDPVGPYYTPLGTDGKPAKFLKAKPLTRPELCTHCKLCAQNCPMGSISKADPADVTGICIKCQACVRHCPVQAKYFDDAAFQSHVQMLEGFAVGRKEIEYF